MDLWSLWPYGSSLGPGCPASTCPLTQFNVQNTRRDQGMAFGHCGIVAAASAVLADLEKRGILKVSFSCMSRE